jgi:fumarate reductase subunit D
METEGIIESLFSAGGYLGAILIVIIILTAAQRLFLSISAPWCSAWAGL